ncbi:SPOR domain-containing protein [Luteimonas sp. R10]|uniref:SPOR domain-containing protein n=1 Tax=Luteimonas sp. R10 TaxID=3108176 RepID=UPI0030895FBC|nr:SPOR domain-containing protein [Luteimonas sp. R10]
MAVKRGKSQARRNSGGNGGLPGWAWMVVGVVLTIAVVLAAPRLLKSDGEDGFYRPRPNPDARPAPASGEDEDSAAPLPAASAPQAETATPQEVGGDYDFYTLLPGQEVPMSDAELAASARAEAERRQRAQAQREDDAAELADPAAAPSTSTAATVTPSTAPAPTAAATGTDASARYLLQAGAFSASGDAEALKARIALLGLSARVESARIGDKTVYRVRMGPYGTASELAEAKRKLGDGGLPAMAIKVQ